MCPVPQLPLLFFSYQGYAHVHYSKQVAKLASNHSARLDTCTHAEAKRKCDYIL